MRVKEVAFSVLGQAIRPSRPIEASKGSSELVGGLYDRQFRESREKLTSYAFAYCHGAAGDEHARDANVEALERFRLVPRALRDVHDVKTGVSILGQRLAAPILVAPMGMQRLLHQRGEHESATAARCAGVGYCLSMFSSIASDDIATSAPALRLQQIYLMRDPRIVDAVVAAAFAAGYAGLLVTVDVPLVAARSRIAPESRTRFAEVVPAMLSLPGVTESLSKAAGSTSPAAMLAAGFPAPEATWRTLRDLIERAPLPVFVKGVLHPDDAAAAVAAGAAGVVVSNHGGRQLDRAAPTVTCLPSIVKAVGNETAVWFDSGVRRGSHVAVAIALGAAAVLVGRPVLWGIASGGSRGATATLDQMVAEFREVMTMLGASRVEDLQGTARETIHSVLDDRYHDAGAVSA